MANDDDDKKTTESPTEHPTPEAAPAPPEEVPTLGADEGTARAEGAVAGDGPAAEATAADATEQLERQAEAFAEQFKSAAQKVLEDRFGMTTGADGKVDFTGIQSEAVKDNARTILLNLMANLAQQGGAQVAGATQGPAGAGASHGEADNVIDLDAERRKREAARAPSELELRVSQTVKATFNEYLREHLVPQGASGDVSVSLDAHMLKEHGPQLATALFGAFAQAIFPKEGVQVNVPVPARAASEDSAEAVSSEAGEEGETEAPEADASSEPAPEAGTASEGGAAAEAGAQVQVKLSVDLAGMFRSLIEGVKPKQ